MAWAGGTFTRANGATEWQDDAGLGIGIEAAVHDDQDNDLAGGINNCLTKDGQNSPTANLSMGGFKHTNAASASGSGQYTTYNQLQDNSFTATLASATVANVNNSAKVEIQRYQAGVEPAFLYLVKSRGATVGANTIGQNGDAIGGIEFSAANGTGYNTIARIRAIHDAAPGATDMPGAITFATMTDGQNSTCPERMRIDNAGRVGIGQSAPESLLHIKGADPILIIQDSDTTIGNTDARLRLAESGAGGGVENYIDIRNNAQILTFEYNGTEAARLNFSTGTFYVGTTADPVGANTEGALIADGNVNVSKNGAAAVYINRMTNDGDLVQFYQAGILEGSISVSGTTITYGAFCGNHWSQLSDGTRPAIKIGTVVETINEMCEWSGQTEERLAKVKISDTEGSKAVYGVFMSWDNDWQETNDMLIASLGAYFVRVPAGTVLAIGDLLESDGTGMAQKQADDVIRSSTIGKVTALTPAHVEADGSFCVPAVLYCG